MYVFRKGKELHQIPQQRTSKQFNAQAGLEPATSHFLNPIVLVELYSSHYDCPHTQISALMKLNM